MNQETPVFELAYLHNHPDSRFCRRCLKKLAEAEDPSVSITAAQNVSGKAHIEGPGSCSICGQHTNVLKSSEAGRVGPL
jgi:hypothetical protein